MSMFVLQLPSSESSLHRSCQRGNHGRMSVCAECGNEIATLYTDYGSGNIRLTQCVRTRARERDSHRTDADPLPGLLPQVCGQRPQVYRHLLFNRNVLKADVWRFGFLLLLFDVYIKWYRLEKDPGAKHEAFLAKDYSLYRQYLSVFACCLVETVVYHAVVQAVFAPLSNGWDWNRAGTISTALVLSGFPKLLSILMVIWDYSQLDTSWLITAMVLTSNAEALGAIPPLRCMSRIKEGFLRWLLAFVAVALAKAASEVAGGMALSSLYR
ncbi:Arv1-like family-domain-containing protein [Hyaloraphidium curvatum]|nr:Arv1-like family-domain-containing protein [Hyaloraphidium curvatum]